MNTPDFTPEAITAIVLGIVTNLIVLFKLDLSDAQRAAVTGLVSAIVLAAFLIHSAVIRAGRAKAIGRANDTALFKRERRPGVGGSSTRV